MTRGLGAVRIAFERGRRPYQQSREEFCGDARAEHQQEV
jgi:hypothetical protein